MNESEKQIVKLAIEILERQLKEPGQMMGCPQSVTNYLRLNLEQLGHEVFAVLFLDSQNCLIEMEIMFRGTLDHAYVYVREVVKKALELGARAVLFSHNHPSGVAEPSAADQRITEKLVQAFQLFEIRVLDHIVIGKKNWVSFAERGLI